jgi:hypothetical protein
VHRGYIKIWRKIMDSFLYLDSETFHLWVTLLFLAGHEGKEIMFNGETQVLKRGQFISGRKSLSEKTGISESKVYRLLEIFEREQLIEQQKTNLFSLISIINYERYQYNEQQDEHPANIQRTTREQRVNTTNTLRSINKKRGDFVPPALFEIESYCKERKNTVSYKQFFDFYESKGWMVGRNKMKDWRAAVRTWEGREKNTGIPGKTEARQLVRGTEETSEYLKRMEREYAEAQKEGKEANAPRA